MSITSYTGLRDNGTVTTVYVQRCDYNNSGSYSPISVYPTSNWGFTNLDAAISASHGALEPGITMFVGNGERHAQLRTWGFDYDKIIDIQSYTSSNPFRIVFTNGRFLEAYLSGTSHTTYERYTNIRYAYGNKSIIAKYLSAYGNATLYSTSPTTYYYYHVPGLISERVYNYSHGRALLSPCIYMNEWDRNYIYSSSYNKFYLGTLTRYDDDRYYGVDSASSAGLYPSFPQLITSDALELSDSIPTQGSREIPIDTTDKFEAAVRFFTDFWNGIETGYYASVTNSVGGTVALSKSFAKVGDTIMINVTPDSSHRINSVQVANTKTESLIYSASENEIPPGAGTKGFTFVMPAANVAVYVNFSSIEIGFPVIVTYKKDKKEYKTSFNLTYDGGE